MLDQITYYVAHGDVRGTCIHKHRTAHTAALCAKRDRRRCARLPGGNSYSDRDVYAIYGSMTREFAGIPE
jgi:hypothetical protein